MSKGDKSDLTRLEDLAHFEHLDDPEIDLLLAPPRENETEEGQGISLDQLSDETTENEITSELSSAFTSDEDSIAADEIPALPEDEAPSDTLEETPPQFQEEIPTFSPESTPEESSETPDFSNFELSSEEVTPKNEEEIQFTQEEKAPPVVEEPREFQAPPQKDHPPIAEPPRRKSEDFQDVKNFAQSISYGKVSVGGNPPFSLMLKNIRYKEDAEDILSILDEHGLLTPDSEEIIKTGIKHGAVLISQISEYSAIFLAHKLRRFNLDIMVGLSEELHQSKNYENSERGLIQRENLQQNHAEHLDLDENPIALENIIITTGPTLPGYKVTRYVELLTEQALIEEEELTQADSNLEETQVYSELVERLKSKAFKLRCNGILGLNYQFLPIPTQNQTRYKIICTGNAVVLSNI